MATQPQSEHEMLASSGQVHGHIVQEAACSEGPARFSVLGVGVCAVQIPEVVDQMNLWSRMRDRCRYIAVTGMHGIAEAQNDPQFKHILNSADLVVADGMPLVWLGRLRGLPLRRRVYGPELMATFCAQSIARRQRHFLYGGDTGVADRLADALLRRFPGIEIAGTCSPPFRPLTKEEDEKHISLINASHADVVWVSLSEVKQDRWMFEHRDRLNVSVLVGIGAAFDFHAGIKSQAPVWMRESGFEWLYRLVQEPKRLWRRYLIHGSQFVWKVALEEIGIRRSKWRTMKPRRSDGPRG